MLSTSYEQRAPAVLAAVRRRFRCGALRLAEWCTAFWVKRGKKKGGGRDMERTESRSLNALRQECRSSYAAALLFPLLTPCAIHHSASDDRNWRNLLRSAANYHKTAWNKLAKLEFIIQHSTFIIS
jgi:hypothetical protein